MQCFLKQFVLAYCRLQETSVRHYTWCEKTEYGGLQKHSLNRLRWHLSGDVSFTCGEVWVHNANTRAITVSFKFSWIEAIFVAWFEEVESSKAYCCAGEGPENQEFHVHPFIIKQIFESKIKHVQVSGTISTTLKSNTHIKAQPIGINVGP